MRTPPGVIAETSPITAFLFSVMCAKSHTLSILLPVTPCRQQSSQSNKMQRPQQFVALCSISVTRNGWHPWQFTELH